MTNIAHGEMNLFIVNLLYPHGLGYESHGNFLLPTYLTLEEAIKHHPERTIIKLHQDKDGKQDVEIVYRGRNH